MDGGRLKPPPPKDKSELNCEFPEEVGRLLQADTAVLRRTLGIGVQLLSILPGSVAMQCISSLSSTLMDPEDLEIVKLGVGIPLSTMMS